MSYVARLTAEKKRPSASHRRLLPTVCAMKSEMLVLEVSSSGCAEFRRRRLAKATCQSGSCESKENDPAILVASPSTNGSARAKFAPLASQNMTRSHMAVRGNAFKSCLRTSAPRIRQPSSASRGDDSSNGAKPGEHRAPAAVGWSEEMCSKMVA